MRSWLGISPLIGPVYTGCVSCHCASVHFSPDCSSFTAGVSQGPLPSPQPSLTRDTTSASHHPRLASCCGEPTRFAVLDLAKLGPGMHSHTYKHTRGPGPWEQLGEAGRALACLAGQQPRAGEWGPAGRAGRLSNRMTSALRTSQSVLAPTTGPPGLRATQEPPTAVSTVSTVSKLIPAP